MVLTVFKDFKVYQACRHFLLGHVSWRKEDNENVPLGNPENLKESKARQIKTKNKSKRKSVAAGNN